MRFLCAYVMGACRLFDNEPPYANRGPGTPQELQSRMNKFADAIFHMQPVSFQLVLQALDLILAESAGCAECK